MPLCAFLPDYVLLWHKFDSVEEAFVVGTSGSAAVLEPLIMGRHFSWIDSGKNAIGAIVGMMVAVIVSFVCKNIRR